MTTYISLPALVKVKSTLSVARDVPMIRPFAGGSLYNDVYRCGAVAGARSGVALLEISFFGMLEEKDVVLVLPANIDYYINGLHQRSIPRGLSRLDLLRHYENILAHRRSTPWTVEYVLPNRTFKVNEV